MLKVYLSGEIHTDWRDQVTHAASNMEVAFSGPVTDHDASDDCFLDIRFVACIAHGSVRGRLVSREVDTAGISDRIAHGDGALAEGF